jgi:hypothetical protein
MGFPPVQVTRYSCISISYMVFYLLFRLPGEAMQIDRVMDAFAAHYCAQNPYLFQGMDIAFAIQYLQST